MTCCGEVAPARDWTSLGPIASGMALAGSLDAASRWPVMQADVCR